MPAALSRPPTVLHTLHAMLLALPVAMFPAALLSDVTYLNSAEMQWSNFAAWLITGALVFGGFVLLGAFIAVLRKTGSLFYLIVVAGMWIVGLVNAFQHSRDAWSSVGTTGLALSVISTVLALVAGWLGFSGLAWRRRA